MAQSELQKGIGASELIRMINTFIPPERAILIQGPPGVGKTDLGKQLGLGGVCEVVDLNAHLPEDLAGYPRPHPENGHVDRLPEAWMAALSAEQIGDSVGVLILDDLSQAGPSMQAAVFRVALERRCGGAMLGPNVRVIITANRRSDKAGAGTLLSPLVSRCWTMTLEPDLDAWLAWSRGDEEAVDNYSIEQKDELMGDAIIDSRVRGYMRFRERNLSHLPNRADSMGRFPCPRTWHFLSDSINGYDSADLEPYLYLLASGFVGDGPAIEFAAWVKHYAYLPDPQKVINDPESVGAITDNDRLIATLMAIVDTGVRIGTKPDKLTRALVIIAAKRNDAAAMAFRHWIDARTEREERMEIAMSLSRVKEARNIRDNLAKILGAVL